MWVILRPDGLNRRLPSEIPLGLSLERRSPHNGGMNDTGQTLPLGRLSRIQHWLARRWVAIVAVAAVICVLGWKNCFEQALHDDSQGYLMSGRPPWEFPDGVCGWPRRCILNVLTFADSPGGNPIATYGVFSWPFLLLDFVIAASSAVVTWTVFRRTQRHCQRWSQVSLSTILAAVTLAGILCAVWRIEPASIGPSKSPVQGIWVP